MLKLILLIDNAYYLSPIAQTLANAHIIFAGRLRIELKSLVLETSIIPLYYRPVNFKINSLI